MTRARKEKEYYSYVEEWKTLWKSDLDALGGYNGNSCDPTRVDPKVIQWAKENCTHMPHFVRVIKTNATLGVSKKHHNCYMSVPIPFVQQHFRELDRVVALEDGEGRTWRVSFGAPRKQPIWHQGWDRVARDLNLTVRDVMVFVLVGKSHFRFTLFDADGNMRRKSAPSSVPHASDEPSLICKEEFPSSSSWSLQDKAPLVDNRLSTEQTEKTKKRLFTVSTDIDPYVYLDSTGGDERDGSAPRWSNAHAEANDQPANQFPVLPAKKQTPYSPPSQERLKMQKTEEKFAAPSKAPNLPIEENIVESTVERDPSSVNVNATSMIDAENCEVDPYNPLQPSPVSCDTPPQFEAIDPLAFIFKSKRRKITALERQRAWESAMAHADILTEHYFVYTMSETHVYRDFHLVLPDHFAAGMSLPPSPTRLKFLDCAGHSWDIYSKRNVYNQFAIHRSYWALFSLHHLLEEGDVCVFALKEIEPVRSVLVHIFRVVPVSSTDITSVHSHYKTHEINATKSCTPNS